MKFGVYVRDIERDFSSEFRHDCLKGFWVMSKYVIGHAHLHQSIWHFRFWFVLAPRACTPNLMKFWPMAFEEHIYGIFGAPYGFCSKCFNRLLPEHNLKLSIKFHDNWTNIHGVMANFLLSPAYTNSFWPMAAMFFDQSWSFVIEMCLFIP